MSDRAVCRTAPATPGLLNRVGRCGSKDSKSRRTSKLHDRFKSYDDFYDVFCLLNRKPIQSGGGYADGLSSNDNKCFLIPGLQPCPGVVSSGNHGHSKFYCTLFNRPGVAGAVLQSAS